MPAVSETIDTVQSVTEGAYKWGFHTDIEMEFAPKGLNEDIVRFISAKKNEPEWLLQWRLKAYRMWLKMEEPRWPAVKYPPIDYQDAYYYAAPTRAGAEEPGRRRSRAAAHLREARHPAEGAGMARRRGPASEADERGRLPIAVDAVFDSVSVATTFKDRLAKEGIIFCSISEAVQNHPELVREYLGTVVPQGDNFFAALNSAVFTDGSFVYIPKGVRCPMELSTYFRINAKSTGQFERTLIIAEEGSHVSYLEGCTAPMRDENQLHAAVVELVAHGRRHHQVLDGAELVSRRRRGPGRHLQLRHQARPLPRRPRQGELDAGGDRLGHHLEVPVLRADRRGQRRRVLLGRHHQQPPAGRHRHQDDPCRQAHAEHHRLQGHLRRPRAEHLPRPGAGGAGGRRRRATSPSATAC